MPSSVDNKPPDQSEKAVPDVLLIFGSDPYPEPWFFWPGRVLGVALVWACFHFPVAWYWYLSGVVVGCLLVAGTLSKQLMIDYSENKMCEYARLCGKRVVEIREFLFTDFEAIIYRDCQSGRGNTTTVGLRHKSGRCFWFRTFNNVDAGRSRGAEEFAWRLSCDTDIEIDERSG